MPSSSSCSSQWTAVDRKKGVNGPLILGLVGTPWPLGVRALSIWLWLGSPLVFLPIVPWRVRFAVGAPLDLTWSEGPEAEDAEVARAQPKVQAELQRLVDGLADDAV